MKNRSYERLLVTQKDSQVTITLNRPEIHNAFDPVMISELTQIFSHLEDDSTVKVVILTGQGKSFCAGADLSWMKSLARASYDENIQDAQTLEKMFQAVGHFSKPLIVVANGAAIGGGFGLVCCADAVLALPEALFCLSEVRLGILPAVIAPYVLRCLGFRMSTFYMLSAKRFGPKEALRIGLINEIVEVQDLSEKIEKITRNILRGGLEAQKATKVLLREITQTSDSQKVSQLTAQAIAERRVSAEGQEGMKAFFEKAFSSVGR